MASSAGRMDGDISHLKLRLLDVWESINAYDRFATNAGPPPETLGLPHLPSPLPEEPQLRIVRRWASIFREEIETVRLVRDAVAHAKPIPDASVREALWVADRLLETLFAGLSEGVGRNRYAAG